jgi:hypothetical protein|uniref:hypothetical protein n=1 Tax=uncultured Sphingomonas sp. TaxID=158754 RepID=UPI0035CB55CE
MSRSAIIQLVLPVFPPAVFAAFGIVALLRRGATNTAHCEIAADGAMIVPVRGLYLRQAGLLGGTSHNNLNPRFAIARDGIRYRVFRERRLPYSSIAHVEIRERFGFVYLLFVTLAGPRLLSVNVGNGETAKRVLDSLPRTVALTPDAAKIRDGTPFAGTSGLRLYHGRFV